MWNPEFVPNLEWYQGKSKSMGGTPRCPFAALRRCPRFYCSVWLMGESAGAAKIDEKIDKELLGYWKQTDLWPIPQELEPTASGGTPNNAHIFSNICPEVAYERFGYFACNLNAYADNMDRDFAHRKLSECNADRSDWRWAWWTWAPQHYSECPMYSQLLAGVKENSHSAPKGRIGF